MAKRKINTKHRLHELLKTSRIPIEKPFLSLGQIGRVGPSFFELNAEDQNLELQRLWEEDRKATLQHKNRLEDEDYRAKIANISTNIIKISSYQSPLERAFEEFKLDPADPYDWNKLINDMAMVLFPEKRPAGRKTLWTGDRYYRLIFDVDDFLQRNPRGTHNAAFLALAVEEAKGKDASSRSPASVQKRANALRTAYRKARNPDCNSALSSDLDELAAAIAPGHVQPDGWKRAIAKTYIKRLLALRRKERSGEKIGTSISSPESDVAGG